MSEEAGKMGWDKQIGEPTEWYARFVSYLLTGPKRSILGTNNLERKRNTLPPQRSTPSSWIKMSRRWNWEERAKRFDDAQAESAVQNHMRLQEQLQQQAMQLAGAMMSKANAMLQFPLVRQKTKDGKTIIVPVKWDFNTAANLGSTGVRLVGATTGSDNKDGTNININVNAGKDRPQTDMEWLREMEEQPNVNTDNTQTGDEAPQAPQQDDNPSPEEEA